MAFGGILFTLKKRVQAIRENDYGLFKFLALGFYDGIDINYVDQWYDLRPRGLHKRNLQVNLETPYADQYTIRGIVPENYKQLEEKGFCYEFWKDVATKKITEFDHYCEQDRKKYPYMVMCMLNLSDEYVQACGNLSGMQEDVAGMLEHTVKDAKSSLAEMHCAFFPSIGYADFVILFLTNDLEKTANVLNQVCEERKKDKDAGKEFAIVSNSYFVFGLDKAFFRGKEYVQGNGNIGITTRLNLQQGVSAAVFLQEFRSELEQMASKKPEWSAWIADIKGTLEEEFYVTYGNSDCLLLSDSKIQPYLCLFGSGMPFDPGGDFFKNHIVSTRTSLRVKGSSGTGVPGNRSADFQTDELKKTFSEFIDRYNDRIEKEQLHVRNSKSLQKVMNDYLNIVQSHHSFAVRCVIGEAFQSLIKDVDYFLGDYLDSTEAVKIAGDHIEIKYVDKAIGIFKDYIGGFLTDMASSDRPFIEGNTLMHPSIGSATKLLFSYCAMLKKLTQKFGVSEKFLFVVISGGCDVIEAIDIFSPVNTEEHIKKIILIHVPEASLYDVQGTLFRMLHECLHFIGDRKRTLRNECLVRAIAEHIAMVIVWYEFNEEQMVRYQESAAQFLNGDRKEAIMRIVEEEYSRIAKETETQIAEEFYKQELFAKYRDEHKDDDNCYRAAYLYEEYLNVDKVIQMFQKVADDGSATFYEFLYNSITAAQRKFLETIRAKLQEAYDRCVDDHKAIYGRALAAYKLSCREEEYKVKNPNKRDKILDDLLGANFDFLVENRHLYKTNWKFDYKQDLAYADIFECVYEAMKESFSDCASICVLDMDLEDFVLSFIYELWDPEEAFPETVPSILRIGADLKVCYGISGSLGCEMEEKIRKKAELRKEQEYEYKNVEEAISVINGLLVEYSGDWCSRMRDSLELYLEECIKDKGYWHSDALGKLYRMSNFDHADEIYRTVTTLIEEWRSLGENTHEGTGDTV